MYKRYIVRNGKRIGPYYYKSIRDKDGKVRNVYVGKSLTKPKLKPFPRPKHILPEPHLKDIPFIAAAIFLVMLLFLFKSSFFSFTGFAAYSYSSDSNLTIWDQTDSGMPYADQIKYANDEVIFFANYTNYTGHSMESECNISFADSPNNLMTHNGTTKIHEYSRSFTAQGDFDFNITCNSTEHSILTASDDVTISGPDNEWVCSNITKCEYQTLTDALIGEDGSSNTIYLLDANTNHIISVPGTYMSYVGSGAAFIKMNNSNQLIDCNNSLLYGPWTDSKAISIEGKTNITILNCIIDRFTYGINANNVTNLNIIDNSLSGARYNGVYVDHSNNILIEGNEMYDNDREGIQVMNFDNANINNNTIYENGYRGIYLQYANNTSVIDNEIYSNEIDGCYMQYSNISSITHNIIYDNARNGISLSYSDIVSIEHSEITMNNRHESYSGISLHDCENITISQVNVSHNHDNDANYNGYEMYLNSVSNALIEDSYFDASHHNQWVVLIQNSPVNVLIRNNTILNSQQDGIAFTSSNDITLLNNRILNSQEDGVSLSWSHNVTLLNNTVLNNLENGLNFDSYSLDLMMEENVICGNNDYDIYNSSVSGTASENTCDTAFNWGEGENSSCTYSCQDNDGDGDSVYTDCNDNNPNIFSPYDDLILNDSVQLCPGDYYIDDVNGDGVIILNGSYITLDCDGAHIHGDRSGIGIGTAGEFNLTEVAKYNITDTDPLQIGLHVLLICSGMDLEEINADALENASELISDSDIIDCAMDIATNISNLKIGNTIKDCEISSYQQAIFTQIASVLSIENNKIHDSKSGVVGFFINSSTIINNEIHNTTDGLLGGGIFFVGFFSKINNNLLQDNEVGIAPWVSYSNEFKENVLKYNEYGIIVVLFINNIISGNIFESNSIGLAMADITVSNYVTDNMFIDNELAGVSVTNELIGETPIILNTITRNIFNNSAPGAVDLGFSDSSLNNDSIQMNDFYFNNFLGNGIFGEGKSNYSNYPVSGEPNYINYYCAPNDDTGVGNYFADSVSSQNRVIGPCDVLDEMFEAYDSDGDGYYANIEPFDCNDNDPHIYPGARERCNGKDDDCDGVKDELSGCESESRGGGGATPQIEALIEPEEETVYHITETSTEITTTKLWDIKFILDGKDHILKLNKLYEGGVDLSIRSNPVNMFIEIGEEKTADLDDDGHGELLVKLKDIAGNRAILLLKKIPKPIGPILEEPIKENKTGDVEPIEKSPLVEEPAGIGYTIPLFVFICILLIISSYGTFILYRKYGEVNQLETYIQESVQKNISSGEIKKHLVKQGWPEDVVDEALNSENQTKSNT